MPSPTSSIQLEEHPCTHFALVIMRRPRRAAVGVLSPRRAPKLGKILRRACLPLIPFPGTGEVLLAPTMISHPLAYVAPNPRHVVRSLAALSSAISNAFLRAATSVVAPNKVHGTLVSANHSSFVNMHAGYCIPLLSSSCVFTRLSSSSARSRLRFSSETSVVRAAAASSDACLFT